MKIRVRLSILVTVCFLFSIRLDAQTFFKQFGDGQITVGQKIIALKNNQGYAIVGTNRVTDRLAEIYLIRTDISGDTLWTKNYGSIFNDGGYAIGQTSDKGFILAGKKGEPDTTSQQLSNAYLIRTDSLGDTLWTFELDSGYGEIAYAAGETFDSTYYIAGTLKSCVGCSSSVGFLAIVDATGHLKWIKSYPSIKVAFSAIQTDEGNFVLTGFSNDLPPYKFYLLKTDALGNIIWEKNNNWGVTYGQIYDLLVGKNENMIITGGTEGNLYLSKLDSSGNLMWYKTYGGNLLDFGKALYPCKSGEYIITGVTSSFASGNGNTSDIWLLRTDENGDTLWTRTYGTNRNDEANDVIEAPDGSFVITGSLNDNQYAFFLKTDSLGNVPDISTLVNKNIIRNEPKVNIYPNPITDELNLKIQLGIMQKLLYIRLLDINGKVLKSFSYSTEKTDIAINVKDISPGIYILQFITPVSFSNYKLILE